VNNNSKEIIFGGLLLVIFASLIGYTLSFRSFSILPTVIAFLIFITGGITFIRQIIKKKRNLETGEPAEDEFSKMASVYAGNQAFLYSLYLWLLIFVFNDSFTKNETMLGIGILGSALIYGISLWYFKTSGDLNE
jgi:peptidoglycan/LPS O-acetylase OafA/YrhL